MLRTLALTTMLLLPAFTLVPGASAWVCTSAADRGVNTVSIGPATYYHKHYPNSGAYIEEVWQESNGEPGLQASPGMSCAGKADRLLRSVCVGFCPIGM